MAFFRIVLRSNGKRYLYKEERFRQGGKVKSRSRSLGPVDGGGGKLKRRMGGLDAFLSAQRLSSEDRALAVAEREAARTEQYQRDHFGETASERAERERGELLTKLHEAYGLKLGPSNPTPIEPQVNQTAAENDTETETETQEGPAEAGPVDAPSEVSE
jgi:hypothetical protein